MNPLTFPILQSNRKCKIHCFWLHVILGMTPIDLCHLQDNPWLHHIENNLATAAILEFTKQGIYLTTQPQDLSRNPITNCLQCNHHLQLDVKTNMSHMEFIISSTNQLSFSFPCLNQCSIIILLIQIYNLRATAPNLSLPSFFMVPGKEKRLGLICSNPLKWGE